MDKNNDYTYMIQTKDKPVKIFKEVNPADCLVITTDFCGSDINTLLVTRVIDELSFEIVNDLHGDEAKDLYNKLIGK